MANCVALSTTNSVPSFYKNSGTRPASNNSSGRGRFRIPAYTNWGDFLSIEGGATQYIYIEFDSTGKLYATTRNASSPLQNNQNIWTDTYTGWFDIIWICSASGFYTSVRRAGGSWSDISPCSAVSFTVSSVRVAGSFLFTNDNDAQHRLAVLELFSTATPGGSSDVATARAFLKGLCDSRSASGDASTIFYNPCTTGADVHTDYSAAAVNWTVTGSPSTITNDDPGFDATHEIDPGIATEVDSAIGLTSGHTVDTGVSTEVDTAQSLGLTKQVQAGTSSEVDSAFGVVNARNLLLESSLDGRYFRNADGEPFFLFGDAGWTAITNLTDTEQEEYLDDRQARGVNCLLIQLIENEFGPSPPLDTEGEAPFTGTAFQSALNEPYWARVDEFFAKCAARSIVCVVNPAYIGFVDDEGWGAEVNAASTGQMTSYGATLGARYENVDGIIWCLYGDRNAYGSKMDALASGLQSGDSRHTLYTTHYARPTSTHDATVPSWATCDYLYAATGLAHVEGDGGWTADIGPVFLGEGRYEHATGIDAFDVRREAWQAALSGGLGGVIVGNEGIWAFDSNSLFPGLTPWQNYLDDGGLVHTAHLAALFASVTFQELVPEAQSASFVTAGRGTYASDAWVPASRNTAGTLAVAYVPGGASITVNMALMAGTTTARWYDPTDGSYTPATGSPLPNSGTHAFVASSEVGTNAAGGNDWALVLEAEAEIEIDVGTTTETDTALAVGLRKELQPGLSIEVDSALGQLDGSLQVSTGTGLETDTGLALVARKVAATGLATEADSSLSPGVVRAIGTVTSAETDTAFSLAAEKRLSQGISAETDAALSLLDTADYVTPGVATEVDSAWSMGVTKRLTPGLALEAAQALAATLSKRIDPGLSQGADSALALALHRQVATGRAEETALALASTLLKVVLVGISSETNVAMGPFDLPIGELTNPRARLQFSPEARAHIVFAAEPRASLRFTS